MVSVCMLPSRGHQFKSHYTSNCNSYAINTCLLPDELRLTTKPHQESLLVLKVKTDNKGEMAVAH